MTESTSDYKKRIEEIKQSIENEPYMAKMREDIAEGISKTGIRQATVEEQFQSVIDNTTDKDVISAPEIIVARGGANTLGERLDSEKAEVSAQLAHIGIQVDDFAGTDDERLHQAIAFARESDGRKIMFSATKIYNFYDYFLIDFPLTFEGAYGLFNQNTTINYKGNGTFLHFVWDSETTAGYGYGVKNITISGSGEGKTGVKVNEYDNVDTGIRAFTMENVTIRQFTRGWGLDLSNAYGNTLLNCTIIQNGGNLRLRNAHATSVFGGAIENSIFGISVEGSRPVNFYGVAIEGYVLEQAPQLNGVIPNDLLVWDGWIDKVISEGGSYLPVTWERFHRDDYIGTGLRNIGSTINLHGCYFELNRYSILNELEAITNVYGGWIEVVQRDRCFADIGHGRFTLTDSNVKIDTLDSDAKVINLSNLRPDLLKILDNKILDETRMIGGHMQYKGYVSDKEGLKLKERTLKSDTVHVNSVTTSTIKFDFLNNYTAFIQNLEKIKEENIVVNATNSYLTINFNPLNTAVFNEGTIKKVIFKSGAVGSQIKFGLNFTNTQVGYIFVKPNEMLTATFLYVDGKMVCTGLVQTSSS